MPCSDLELKELKNFFTAVTCEGDPDLWLPAGTLSPQEALKVYQDGYIARLTTSLGENFETVWKYVGDEIFFDLAKLYIAENPSRDGNLNLYGQGFPEFLMQIEAVEDHPFLPDLARADWMKAQLFHQKTEPGLSGENLATQLSGETCLRFVSSVQVLSSSWDLFLIWKSIHRDEPMPEQQAGILLLWKRDSQVMIQGFGTQFTLSLQKLSEGTSLEQIVAGLSPEDVQFLFEFVSEERLISTQT